MPHHITDKLVAVFREVLELASEREAREARSGLTQTWDSLNHVVLVAAIENEFGITIDIDDSLQMTSFNAARELLARHGIAVHTDTP